MKKILAILFLLSTALATGYAQTLPVKEDRPNLSGMWTLDIAKSDFGQIPAPTSAHEEITQTGDTLKFALASETSYGGRNYAFSLVADGTEQLMPEGTFPTEAPFKVLSSTAEWHGSVLALSQKASFQGAPGTVRATYTLSPDGKVLTKLSHISMPMGDFDTRAIFDKQPGL
jgi:hypothetical protein